MLKSTSYFLLLFILLACTNSNIKNNNQVNIDKNIIPHKIIETPLPKGFERENQDKNSFAFYLQNINFKLDNTVYYYDGNKKANQNLHYAVLDIPLANKDLQQCADAIMRLRAMYFLDKKEYNKIAFKSGNTVYNFQLYLNTANTTNINSAFENFMQIVFANCGTYNLNEMLFIKPNFSNLTIGDVFVKAGSPGHAMIVVDVAVNKNTKEKIYLLAQSFMPAQSIHIVKNLSNNRLSPWYKIDSNAVISTPGYVFATTHLKCW